jgi:hypothetical protein
LPIVLTELRSYSLEHDGFFPNDEKDPIEALRKLYPRYLPVCEHLAGLSGNIKLLKKQVLGGSKITADASSWVYWRGLRADDDEHIALFWERESGVRFNGRRGPGREVGFVNGVFRVVPDDRWSEFLKDQERLREMAIKSRDGERNLRAPAGWSEREAAGHLRYKFNASGGCLPSLTLNVGRLGAHETSHHHHSYGRRAPGARRKGVS